MSVLRGIAAKIDMYFIKKFFKEKKDNSPGAGWTNAINYLVMF